MATKIISAREQMRAAQSFNFFSILSILIPIVIPLWIAASIFVYAAVAHHPNPRVKDFLTYAGYRFYGLTGSLVAVLNFSPQFSQWAGGGLNLALIVWALAFLIIVPWGVMEIRKAGREPWQTLTVETE